MSHARDYYPAMRATWRRTIRRVAIAASVLLLAGMAHAGELANFNGAVAAAYAHYRGAISYLRTGNVALAAFELDDMAAKWRDVTANYSDATPDAFADETAWAPTLRSIGTRIDQALAAIDAGQVEAALEAIAPIRDELADLRERNGITVFSDRVNEVSAAMEALWVYRHGEPDLASAEVTRDIAAKTAVLAYLFGRCREQAPAAVREDAAFIRMIDGSEEGIKRMWRALDERDQSLLVNTLRELRSFEQILFLRFG